MPDIRFTKYHEWEQLWELFRELIDHQNEVDRMTCEGDSINDEYAHLLKGECREILRSVERIIDSTGVWRNLADPEANRIRLGEKQRAEMKTALWLILPAIFTHSGYYPPPPLEVLLSDSVNAVENAGRRGPMRRRSISVEAARDSVNALIERAGQELDHSTGGRRLRSIARGILIATRRLLPFLACATLVATSGFVLPAITQDRILSGTFSVLFNVISALTGWLMPQVQQLHAQYIAGAHRSFDHHDSFTANAVALPMAMHQAHDSAMDYSLSPGTPEPLEWCERGITVGGHHVKRLEESVRHQAPQHQADIQGALRHLRNALTGMATSLEICLRRPYEFPTSRDGLLLATELSSLELVAIDVRRWVRTDGSR